MKDASPQRVDQPTKGERGTAIASFGGQLEKLRILTKRFKAQVKGKL